MLGYRFAALIAAAFATVLPALALPPVTLDGFVERPSSVNFTVKDARPAKEKESEQFSFWVTSCNYGVFQVGDDKMVPTPPVLLRHDLEAAFGEKLRDKALTLTRYRIVHNNRQRMRAGVFGSTPGVVSSVMKDASESCTKEKTTAGWYDLSEVTDPYPPFIVEVAANMGGKTYSIRVVVSVQLTETYPRYPQVFDAMHVANAALVEQIRKDLPV